MRQKMTGKAVSTLTPENSEAPRESRGDVGLVERFDAARERVEDRIRHEILSGAGLGVDASGAARTKVSSPELASLAAKYIDTSAAWLASMDGDMEELARDIRSLAASVLAQAEGTPRK